MPNLMMLVQHINARITIAMGVRKLKSQKDTIHTIAPNKIHIGIVAAAIRNEFLNIIKIPSANVTSISYK